MSRGFFPASAVMKSAPPSLIAKCGACGLFKTCQSPKMPYSGKGARGILIVGEAPGADEDQVGKQFIGKAGQRLQKELARVGIDMRSDCWITNALICRPPGNKIPNDNVVDYCRPNLIKTIRELRPTTIILLGGSAVKSLISDTWKENPDAITKWVGWNIPDQKYNAWICPTYHPSYLERERDPVLDLYFHKHLRRAVKHTERPWNPVPDWESKIEVILGTDKAAKIIHEFIEAGGLCAGDYEGNCLKPEYEGAQLISCAICWEGKRTISYPWHGAAITATRAAWHADSLRWIASNMKHEDRFTRHDAGKGVRHWAWDTMVAAHVLDNRRGITGLKFQSYVELGMPAYDDHIKPFLRAVGDEKINRAQQEVDLFQLLRYGGFDVFLEYMLGVKQHQKLQRRNDRS